MTTTKHTVRMIGHGLNVTFPGFGGLPTYCTAPRALTQALEATYRSAIGDSTGSLATASNWGRVRQLSDGVFQTSEAVEFSLYKVGADGTARRDDTTRRVFRLYSQHDYR